jgi:hypothetical protein
MLKQKELFKAITTLKLTPNQYYALMSIVDQSPTELINITEELNVLVTREYVIVTNENKLYVTQRGKNLVKKIESIFTKQAENAAGDILGDDWEDKIQEYINIFPAIKLPTGKYARDSKPNIKNAFKWFFNNYNYSWDVILDATEKYVDDYVTSGYKYMRTSKYFIRKQDTDKSYSSDLANYCEMILSDEVEEPIIHAVKVV